MAGRRQKGQHANFWSSVGGLRGEKTKMGIKAQENVALNGEWTTFMNGEHSRQAGLKTPHLTAPSPNKGLPSLLPAWEVEFVSGLCFDDFITAQQNKKRRGPGKKCHARNYDAQ
jgi:hypothetical protein